MAEYESLLLVLKLVKILGAIIVSIIGDSKLIIKQIKGKYLTRDPRLEYYRGTVIEILNNFLETQLATIPRKHNLQAHSLAMFSSTCKLPFQPNHQFTAEIRHRPAIPNNLKNQQVFDSDEQINSFLTLDEEFSNNHIDIDTTISSNKIDEVETNIFEESTINMLHPKKFTQKEVQDLQQVDLDEIIEEETEVINLK